MNIQNFAVQIFEHGMCGACSKHMGRLGSYSKFWSKNLKEGEHSEDLGVDRKILDWILDK